MSEAAEDIERKILKPVVDAFLDWNATHLSMFSEDTEEREGEELLWREFTDHMRVLTAKVYPNREGSD